MQSNGFKPGMAAPARHCPEPSTHRAGDPAIGPAQIETAGALQGTTAAIECQRFDFAHSQDVSPEAATDALRLAIEFIQLAGVELQCGYVANSLHASKRAHKALGAAIDSLAALAGGSSHA